MKMVNRVSAWLALIIVGTSMSTASSAIVWGSSSYFGDTTSGTFRFAVYALHNSLTDDDYYSNFGVYANIGMPGDYWPGFADSTSPVTDSNVNMEIGNQTTVGIYDGTYSMQAWLEGNESTLQYVPVSAACYEDAQECVIN